MTTRARMGVARSTGEPWGNVVGLVGCGPLMDSAGGMRSRRWVCDACDYCQGVP